MSTLGSRPAVADDVVEHLVGCVNHTRCLLQWGPGEAESAFRYDGVSTEHRRHVEHGDARAAQGRLECRGQPARSSPDDDDIGPLAADERSARRQKEQEAAGIAARAADRITD